MMLAVAILLVAAFAGGLWLRSKRRAKVVPAQPVAGRGGSNFASWCLHCLDPLCPANRFAGGQHVHT